MIWAEVSCSGEGFAVRVNVATNFVVQVKTSSHRRSGGPAAGMFGLFLKQNGLAEQFRFGREADGAPAAPWGWEDLD